MDKEIIQDIASLRRNQGRNLKTMRVLDAYEHLWSEYQKLARADHLEVVQKVECPKCEENKRKVRDRVARFRQRKATA
jgi:hypothetical protein